MLREPVGYQAFHRVASSTPPALCGCRAKAVRLIANKLFPNILLTAEIQRFAAAQLQKLCQQPQQNGKRRREEAAAPEEEVPKRQRQMAEEQPGGNGSQAEVIDGVHGDGPKLNGVPKAGVEGGERQAETASPGRGAEKRKGRVAPRSTACLCSFCRPLSTEAHVR